MKKYIKYSFLALGAVAMLSSCDENSWNDKLDGFEVPQPGSTASAMTYTLTDADYNKIATAKPYTTYAAEHEQADMLKTIAATHSFASEEEARPYLQMFLRDSTNNFFVLPNGSAVKLSYNVDTQVPEVVKAINKGVEQYTVSREDYVKAWGSSEDYIEAFAPATPATRFVPGILRMEFPDAENGSYAVVTYNQAEINPIFGSVGGGDTPAPTWEPTRALGGIDVGDDVVVNGWITALCTRGFVLTDLGGSVFCYGGSTFVADGLALGQQVSVNGTISAYGAGFQISISDNYSVNGPGEYTYPAPKVYTGAMMDEAVANTDPQKAVYCQITGKAIVGTYINFEVEGAETAQGSVYYASDELKAQFVDGQTYTLTGYFTSVSSARYFNIIVTNVQAGAAKPMRRTVASDVPSAVTNAIYTFNGSAWTVATGVDVLQPADYTAMGQTYGNLSGTLPSELLPKYLMQKYPYANADQEVTVAYKYYGGGVTTYQAAQYTFNGSAWVRNSGEVTSQFVCKDGFWQYNPSVVIDLPYSRNTDPSYTYYMACVNWVFDNISKEMGGTSLTSAPFIDYRGNAEFYSGASAYYGNVDVRATTARNNAPDGYTVYDDMTDEEVVLLVEKRFCLETMPGALSALHPDAMPVDGMEVTYTINFTAYETGGVAVERQLVYVVSGPGQFKYKSCTWFENGEDAEW